MVSARRDSRQLFRPKIRPTPPGGVPAGRNAGSFRSTPHPMCLLQTQNPPTWTVCTKFPPPPPFRTRSPNTLYLPCSSLRSTRGPAPAPPSNNKTRAVATNRLVCAPPCVCTALCVDSRTFPAARFARHGGQPPHPPSITRLLQWSQTALCVHRLVCGQPNLPCSSLCLTRGPTPAPPFNNKTPAVVTNRLVCAPPCVWTAEPSLQLALLDTGASPRTPLQ